MLDSETIYYVNGGRYTKRQMVTRGIEQCLIHKNSDGYDEQCLNCPYFDPDVSVGDCKEELRSDALDLLKEQEKRRITIHKKHVITWRRNDEFSMRKLYEAICETLLDEGELFVARTDDHEKVDFVFYVADRR